MPVIEVHLLEGYTPEEHHRLGDALTDAIRLVVPAPAEAITVMIHEMADSHYYRGRGMRTPAAALPDPCDIVHAFLKHLGARDFEAAKAYLSEEFSMHFPGCEPMYTLEELFAWSKPRYRRISKTFESTEAFADPKGASIVYCRGTLSGEWPDGTVFDGIRFIDRFELVDGKLILQDVWNDLAEHRPAAGKA